VKNESEEKTGIARRDFLSFAAFGTVILSAITVLAETLRIIKPNVHYEESRKFKIGKPENFPVGTVKKLEEEKVFIFAEDDGFYAISSICTHLGCIVYSTETGFQCPCHGSKYDAEGNVVGGPAPRGLSWYEISQAVDGTLVVDSAREVPKGTKYIYA
jgi:cytochrome b6-f complex iron-sulfur subunit